MVSDLLFLLKVLEEIGKVSYATKVVRWLQNTQIAAYSDAAQIHFHILQEHMLHASGATSAQNYQR